MLPDVSDLRWQLSLVKVLTVNPPVETLCLAIVYVAVVPPMRVVFISPANVDVPVPPTKITVDDACSGPAETMSPPVTDEDACEVKPPTSVASP
ncbi:MAG: hypothetical protein G01um101448_983, partial [Parcubacteria group bacterium Gr01-1014_48]